MVTAAHDLPIQVFDTIKPYKIEIVDREDELLNVWNQIASSKLVITDRLHAMIFCYLLHIPCIVLKTYNYKLIAQYEWIKEESFIELCENHSLNNITNKMNNLLTMEFIDPINDFSGCFETLKKLLDTKAGE